MIDPLAQVKHLPRHQIALAIPPSDRLHNTLPKLLGHDLVRIERKYPLAPRVPERHVLLPYMTGPRMLKHPIRVSPRDPDGPIFAE
jgi:hypothetical protein